MRMNYLILLQEVHGSGPRLRRAVGALPFKYHVLYSGGGVASTGGVAMLIPKADALGQPIDIADLAAEAP
eukprot:1502558-Pyramimonas_sp.AAC.1